jgi:chromosome partitioning protein
LHEARFSRLADPTEATRTNGAAAPAEAGPSAGLSEAGRAEPGSAGGQPVSSDSPPPAPPARGEASGDGSAGKDEGASGPRVIALMNQKGGVGKTTTAVNVAAALADEGHQVLAIDLDPQAHLTLSFGIDPQTLEKSIYHLLSDDGTAAAEIVQQVSDSERRHLGVLPAEVNLAGVESELAEKTVAGAAQTVLRNKTRDLVQHFDYVILDCPPSLGLLTINALTTAHEVIVPMQAHFLALQGLSKLLETVQMVRSAINAGLLISGIVLCMHERQTVLASEVVTDLNQFLEEARGRDSPWSEAVVYQPPVRRNIKLAESPSFGQSVFGYAPESKGACDYRELARHIASHRVAVGAERG